MPGRPRYNIRFRLPPSRRWPETVRETGSKPCHRGLQFDEHTYHVPFNPDRELVQCKSGLGSGTTTEATCGTRGRPKTGPQPKLVVKKPSLDLGEAKEGAVVDAVFVLENRGDADLKIDNIRASCGCTTVKLTEEEKTIPPGGAQKLVAKFNTKGRAGPQTKTVQVFTNDPEQPQMTLRFTAKRAELGAAAAQPLYGLWRGSPRRTGGPHAQSASLSTRSFPRRV